MNKKYFTDSLSEEIIIELTGEMIKEEAMNKSITKPRLNNMLLRAIPAAAMIALVIGLVNLLPALLNSTDIDVGNAGINQTEEIELFVPWVIEQSFFEERILAVMPEGRLGPRTRMSSYYILRGTNYVLDGATTQREANILLGYLEEYTDLTGNDMMQMILTYNLPLENPNPPAPPIRSAQSNMIVLTEPTPVENADDFDLAMFDLARDSESGTMNRGLPSLTLRFNGTFNEIDPDDLTDIILTKDGIVIENNLTYNGRFEYGFWWNGAMTDFYFDFDFENTEPGIYRLTGKYKGVDFEVGNTVVETYPLGDEPANPDDLIGVGFVGMPIDPWDRYSGMGGLMEITIQFSGVQQAFCMSDLTDLKLTLNGEETPFEVWENVVMRYVHILDNRPMTSFHLILIDPLDMPGTYQVSGYYRGTAFYSFPIEVVR
jgi:hypothetical protein